MAQEHSELVQTWPAAFYFDPDALTKTDRRQTHSSTDTVTIHFPRLSHRRRYIQRRAGQRPFRGATTLVEKIAAIYCDPYRESDPVTELHAKEEDPFYQSEFQVFNTESCNDLSEAIRMFQDGVNNFNRK